MKTIIVVCVCAFFLVPMQFDIIFFLEKLVKDMTCDVNNDDAEKEIHHLYTIKTVNQVQCIQLNCFILFSLSLSLSPQ